jgi:hypothetical protein
MGQSASGGSRVVGKAAASYFGNKEDQDEAPTSEQQIKTSLLLKQKRDRRPEPTPYPVAIRFLKLPNASTTMALNGNVFLMRIAMY